MLNVTVIGTVRDSDGHLQNGSYTVEYKDRGVLVPSTDTVYSQIEFNVGDHSHLGCAGSLRKGDVVYVEFVNSASNKYARRLIEYNEENVILLDTVCKEDWGLTTSLAIQETTDGVFNLSANSTGDLNIFRVYISKEKIFSNANDTATWILADTIKTDADNIELAFAKSIYAKVEVETVTEGHTSAVEAKELEVNVGNDTPELLPHVFMIEWE